MKLNIENMLRYILITILLLPFIDFYVLVQVAEKIGLLNTLSTIIFIEMNFLIPKNLLKIICEHEAENLQLYV